MQFTIDKNVPVPTSTGRGIKRWPFADMEVGDSVLFPKEIGRRAAQWAGGFTHQRRAQKHKVIPIFKSRTEKDGVRIWRVA